MSITRVALCRAGVYTAHGLCTLYKMLVCTHIFLKERGFHTAHEHTIQQRSRNMYLMSARGCRNFHQQRNLSTYTYDRVYLYKARVPDLICVYLSAGLTHTRHGMQLSPTRVREERVCILCIV